MRFVPVCLGLLSALAVMGCTVKATIPTIHAPRTVKAPLATGQSPAIWMAGDKDRV